MGTRVMILVEKVTVCKILKNKLVKIHLQNYNIPHEKVIVEDFQSQKFGILAVEGALV